MLNCWLFCGSPTYANRRISASRVGSNAGSMRNSPSDFIGPYSSRWATSCSTCWGVRKVSCSSSSRVAVFRFSGCTACSLSICTVSSQASDSASSAVISSPTAASHAPSSACPQAVSEKNNSKTSVDRVFMVDFERGNGCRGGAYSKSRHRSMGMPRFLSSVSR